jgi:hypothetical protein
LNVAESPHANITRRLRHDLRELRDIAHHIELTALCISSISGNHKLDAVALSSDVSDELSRALHDKLPYMKSLSKNPQQEEPQSYDEYFKMLDEMENEEQLKKTKAAPE